MENPDFFQGNYAKNGDHFIIEDPLDFPKDDVMLTEDTFDSSVGASTNSSAATVVDASCNSSFSGSSTTTEPHFPGGIGGCQSFADEQFSNTELCMQHDDLAELEWLSNFVEESFSSEEFQRLHLIQGMKARTDEPYETRLYQFHPETTTTTIDTTPMLRPQMPVPAKARSKRSRSAPGNWTSRLLALSPTPLSSVPAMPASSESEIAVNVGKKPMKAMAKKKEGSNTAITENDSEGRKCLHCSTDKTPQWRTGPMGPKTLCNACGVRYKSGRLVPEYRPAASPTFVLTKHSNSHRKVLELRRQKELRRAHQHQQYPHQNITFDVSDGDDYLIHQHIGPDYGQLI
ncbi:GATA transcription factor 9-like [Olea europaea var. sylvestris]|uniref:GATA transcription factor 9-like n=1 Tax=Olea europaea var. sylvestris TaxID=158386 RepID=UPI000C1D2973|nr:GATA transcription factor 9-like [Olea europaea var. sylvestris]